jgi:hypothetical protein
LISFLSTPTSSRVTISSDLDQIPISSGTTHRRVEGSNSATISSFS